MPSCFSSSHSSRVSLLLYLSKIRDGSIDRPRRSIARCAASSSRGRLVTNFYAPSALPVARTRLSLDEAKPLIVIRDTIIDLSPSCSSCLSLSFSLRRKKPPAFALRGNIPCPGGGRERNGASVPKRDGGPHSNAAAFYFIGLKGVKYRWRGPGRLFTYRCASLSTSRPLPVLSSSLFYPV